MPYYVSDLGDAIDEFNKTQQEHLDQKTSEDAVEDAKQNMIEIAQSLYFDEDGKFDKTAYQMYKPDGALINVNKNRVTVDVNDPDDPEGTIEVDIPSPGPQ